MGRSQSDSSGLATRAVRKIVSSIGADGPRRETRRPEAVVRRPDARKFVLDLTRQLAEEFDSISIPLVTSAVKSAVNAVTLFGDDVVASIDTVERIAREDLAAIRESATAA